MEEREQTDSGGGDVRELLEAVPNVSAGRDRSVVDAIVAATREGLLSGAREGESRAVLADVHRDADHDRSVLTLLGWGEALARGLEAMARAAVERIDLHAGHGVHPRVGALDVLPIVALRGGDAAGAAAHALVRRLGRTIGDELGVPLVRYGLDEDGAPIDGAASTGAVRRGGPAGVEERIVRGGLALLGGPRTLHPSAGAVVCGVREVLVAFNVDLATGDLDLARAIAARVREQPTADDRPDALPGVRALGLLLASRGCVQVSTNVERHRICGPARVLDSVARIAAGSGVRLAAAELVGLAPDAALAPLRSACTRLRVPLLASAEPLLERAISQC